jgi:molybdopterin-guanine dinucleotide biosynthesis protein A
MVDCIVLAGGLARRFGGRDKGLILLKGLPLVDWVIRRIEPQVQTLVVSANRNLDEYAALGHAVVVDAIPGHVGPLAGIYTAAQRLSGEWVLTAPCDTPFLPLDLAHRLLARAQHDGLDAVHVAEATQAHYTLLLFRRSRLEGLGAFLAAGGRRMQDWVAQLRAQPVVLGDDPHAFLNVNTPADLALAERLAPRYAPLP